MTKIKRVKGELYKTLRNNNISTLSAVKPSAETNKTRITNDYIRLGRKHKEVKNRGGREKTDKGE